MFASAWLWMNMTMITVLVLAAVAPKPIETEAFTPSWTPSWTPSTHSILRHNSANTRPQTSLFSKKKKKKGGGDGGSATTKIQVKLLQHIAGTGQAGDVILVNPIFFANKLRPQKLARMITDEEVQKDNDVKQMQSDELLKQAKALKDLIDTGDDDENDNSGDTSSSYFLAFLDNQTGPDGKKLFGGIGPKKLLECLRKDCKEFDAYSKQYTKQVSILGVEEQEVVVPDDGATDTKYKDYSSYSSSSEPAKATIKYSPLPKNDKLTIKHTGVFRMKVALTKDSFARVKVVVE